MHILALVLFLIMVVTACFAWHEKVYGAGAALSFSSIIFLVCTLGLWTEVSQTTWSKGYSRQFLDTAWTTVVVVSADSQVVRFVDLPDTSKGPDVRAVFYEMSGTSFNVSPEGTISYQELLLPGVVADLRVVVSPEGFRRIEFR